MKQILLTFLLAPSLAFASPTKSAISAKVIKIYDGDTIRVQAFPWPDFTPKKNIRIIGIDTPEKRSKCEAEKLAAKEAEEYLASILTDEVMLTNIDFGKYARRLLADVTTSDGVNIAEAMIEAGHARRYGGEKRKGWCDDNK